MIQHGKSLSFTSPSVLAEHRARRKSLCSWSALTGKKAERAHGREPPGAGEAETLPRTGTCCGTVAGWLPQLAGGGAGGRVRVRPPSRCDRALCVGIWDERGVRASNSESFDS